MRIEVRELSHGWRTLHLLGARRDIINGVVKVESPPDNKPTPAYLLTEYLMAMTAVGLAAIEARGSASESPRCLFLGLGGGALPAFMAHHVPDASLVAVEIDEATCEAATYHMGLDGTSCTIVCADGLEWIKALGDDEVFDAVFVDIFDERNLCPKAFYSEAFLQRLSKQMTDEAVIVHNMHSGGNTLDAEIEVAEAAYKRVFGAARRTSTLNSKPWAGNAIIGASRAGAWDEAALLKAAEAARRRLQISFDLAGRL